ncbi:Auxin response factor 3 [Hordeum vulgare]|nr:Auxin response factor 3 [Hordeum vulgare]
MSDTFSQGHGSPVDSFTQGQDAMGSTFPVKQEFPDDYRQEEQDGVDIDGESLFFEDDLTAQANAGKKRQRKSTKAYTNNKDKLLCECWRDIAQDPKIGVKQKASTFWLRVHRQYHEREKFVSYRVESKCGWMFLSKRRRVIQQECDKFYATFESIKDRPVTGLSIKDMVFNYRLPKLWMHSNLNTGTNHSTSPIVG